MSAGHHWPYLRDIPRSAKVGVGSLLLVVLGGIGASAWHLWDHYQNRDEEPGLTMTDLKGAYHGVTAESPILGAIQRGHPEILPQADRAALLAWLKGEKIAENFDNLDLGDRSPHEIIAARCLECHSRRNAEKQPIARSIPLDSWEDIKPRAFSKHIEPANRKVMIASAHAHSLSLATLTLVLAGLLAMTTGARGFKSALVGAMGLGLLVDLSCWFVAREFSGAVYAIVLAGAVYNGGVVLAALLVLFDLARPAQKS